MNNPRFPLNALATAAESPKGAVSTSTGPSDRPQVFQLESEMKFALSEDQARDLLQSSLVSRFTRGRASTRQLTSTYYDTRQHSLRKLGAALRVRQSDASFEQTIKMPGEGPLGMQNCHEWTVPLPDEVPEVERFEPGLARRLQRRDRPLNLRPMFTSEIRRTAMVIKRGKTRFEMAVDLGRIHSYGARPRSLPVSEVEFELQRGDPVVMLDFILELSNQVGLVPLYLSKAQRGYALARPSLRPVHRKARKVQLEAGMSVGEAFQRIVSEALQQLQSNQQPTMDGLPGGVHQARVSIRRIRAALRAFKRVLPYDKRKAFNGEFRWFQARLSPARDWHVFISETLPKIRKHQPRKRVSLARLSKVADVEQRRATAEAQELFSNRRFTRLVLQFQRWVMSLETEHPEIFNRKLRPFARSVLAKTRRDFLADTRPLSRMSEEDRHGLRKRGKKARYAMEFFAGLWEGPEVDSYLELMEAIQDQLGKANDASTARHLMACLPPKALKPSTIWAVQTWSDQRTLQSIRPAQSTWRGIQKAHPFWA